ncbi:MAG: glucoamylase family protein [Steroidobacteraceae bacterium]
MYPLNRRTFIEGLGATAAAGLAACTAHTGLSANAAAPLGPPPPLSTEALLNETQRRTFNFFWQTTDAAHGLAPDLTPDGSPASIAAIGFALTALPIGVERGWVARSQALARATATLQFLRDAPQGDGSHECSGYRGFFYHFLDMSSGTRYRNSELSSVDTALLLMGVRCCAQYFNAPSAEEAALRTLSEELCERVEWPWLQAHGPAICMGWRPETGFLRANWIGYNEAMMVYLLALGSASHPVGPEAWAAWTAGYPRSWGRVQDIEHLTFGPHFGHQFTQVWFDLHGPSDAYMRARGLDYFENSRRATLSQHAYAIANPLGWAGYRENVWGLSASDGPVSQTLPYRGQQRAFHTYAARGVCLNPAQNYDDGTLTPMAALGSLPFAPELVLPAMDEMYRRYGAVLFGEYGFLDSFNPSFQYELTPTHGRRVGELGWVDTRYYGINQGPLLAMIENHRSGLLWRLSREDAVLRRGLQRAGFQGGWLG